MTDPDERAINRAIALVSDSNMDEREEARAALHRLFRDRRTLERSLFEARQALLREGLEVGMLEKEAHDAEQAKMSTFSEVERLQAELAKWEARFPKGVVITEMECLKLVDEVERLRVTEHEAWTKLSASRAEVERLAVENDALVERAFHLGQEVERLQAIIEANDNYDQDATEREVERLERALTLQGLETVRLEREAEQHADMAVYMFAEKDGGIERLRAANEKNKAYVLELEAEVSLWKGEAGVFRDENERLRAAPCPSCGYTPRGPDPQRVDEELRT
jgi:hypothetical protein